MSGLDDIVQVEPAAQHVPAGRDLVIALSGFSDAGQLVPQLDSALLGRGTPETVAVFDADVLFDYRARRPAVVVEDDRISSVTMPSLELSQVRDASGVPFLYLHGFEPDFRWESVVAAIEDLVAEFDVRRITWFHSIPMPVPHTRPVHSAMTGNRPELTAQWSVWHPTTQVPGSLLHVLEHALIEDSDGRMPVAGFVLMAPHYLAESEIPAVLGAALERLASATGLDVVEDGIAERQKEFATKVDQQVADNAELAMLVANLEQRHDEFIADVERRHDDETAFENLPSADELAAEFESFLASQTDKSPDKGDSPEGHAH